MTVRLVTAIDDTLTDKIRPSAPVAVVAKDLGADPSQVRRLIRDGDLEAHRLGKCGIRVYLDSVAEYQRQRPVKGKKAAEISPLDTPKPMTRASRAAHQQALASLQSLGLVPASRR